jgi:hypothetical protein
VSALPPSAVRATVKDELDGARAWAARHNWSLDWNPEQLLLKAATYHHALHRLVEVIADTDGYRAVPPAWRFVRPGTDELDPAWFPKIALIAMVGVTPVICAPWNRLAYQEHGGPHENWSGASAWLQVNEGTIAHTIPDMLQLIEAHLRGSTEMVV